MTNVPWVITQGILILAVGQTMTIFNKCVDINNLQDTEGIQNEGWRIWVILDQKSSLYTLGEDLYGNTGLVSYLPW